MGRLIDADAVKKKYPQMENKFGMIINEGLHIAIESMPTVQAIPKADYENRLKADLKAILVELQLEIEEMSGLHTEIRGEEWSEVNVVHSQDVLNLIQEKINALRGEK